MQIKLGSSPYHALGLAVDASKRAVDARANLPGVVHACMIANTNGGLLSLRRVYGRPTRARFALAWRTPGIRIGRRDGVHLITPGVSVGVLRGNWSYSPRTGGVVEGGLTIGPRS